MNRILLSAIIGFTLATSNFVYALSPEAPATFTEEQCKSLYLVKWAEKLMMGSGFVLLLIADGVHNVARNYHLPPALAIIPVAGAIFLFSYLAYGMAHTPFRTEREMYCAKMERKKQRIEQRQTP